MLLACAGKEGANAKPRRFNCVHTIGSPLPNDAISHAQFGITGRFVIEQSNDLPRVLYACTTHVSCEAHVSAVPLRS